MTFVSDRSKQCMTWWFLYFVHIVSRVGFGSFHFSEGMAHGPGVSFFFSIFWFYGVDEYKMQVWCACGLRLVANWSCKFGGNLPLSYWRHIYPNIAITHERQRVNDPYNSWLHSLDDRLWMIDGQSSLNIRSGKGYRSVLEDTILRQQHHRNNQEERCIKWDDYP